MKKTLPILAILACLAPAAQAEMDPSTFLVQCSAKARNSAEQEECYHIGRRVIDKRGHDLLHTKILNGVDRGQIPAQKALDAVGYRLVGSMIFKGDQQLGAVGDTSNFAKLDPVKVARLGDGSHLIDVAGPWGPSYVVATVKGDLVMVSEPQGIPR